MDINHAIENIIASGNHVLVKGGPGSGKTTLALMKAKHAIEKKLTHDQNVLFLSFSRAAIARIVDASKSMLTAEQLSMISMQTFHSFFWEILRSRGYLLGAPKKLTLLLPHDEKVLSNGIKSGSDQWPQWLDKRQKLFVEDGKTAFDLFAPKVKELLVASVAVQKLICQKYPLIIVDEAQDTNHDQWAIVKMLSTCAQVMCMADLEQQIYDFIPGVGPQRIAEIEQDLQPHIIDLGSTNRRSPSTEIAIFADDILKGTPRNGKYNGVTQLNFQGRAATRDLAIRRSVGMISTYIQNKLGRSPKSIAILSSYDKGVAIITNALRAGPKEIPHRVLFDETDTLLASRLLAFLIEPKNVVREKQDLITALTLVSTIFRANGTPTALKQSQAIELQISKTERDERLSSKLSKALKSIITQLQTIVFSGDPVKDWTTVRLMLRSADSKELNQIDRDLSLLMAYNRGKRIHSGLQNSWLANGGYHNARQILDSALSEDQLLSDRENLSGIHVMTMHKSKGKQFEAVVILRINHLSPFVWSNDNTPHTRSRKILRVAITRAEHHVLILNDVFNDCDILSKFSL